MRKIMVEVPEKECLELHNHCPMIYSIHSCGRIIEYKCLFQRFGFEEVNWNRKCSPTKACRAATVKGV